MNIAEWVRCKLEEDNWMEDHQPKWTIIHFPANLNIHFWHTNRQFFKNNLIHSNESVSNQMIWMDPQELISVLISYVVYILRERIFFIITDRCFILLTYVKTVSFISNCISLTLVLKVSMICKVVWYHYFSYYYCVLLLQYRTQHTESAPSYSEGFEYNE